MTEPTASRRTFLKGSSAALVGSALLTERAAARDTAAGERELRVALVGCGGRGTGAAAPGAAHGGRR